ncbi:arrestin domain-containing protein 17 [Sergentomyia squamirostris]
MAKCLVTFDNNPSGIYSTGQTLSGRVELTIPKVKTVKVVTLNIVGYAKCRWEETELRSHGYHGRTYKGRVDYISFSMNLVEPEKGEKTVDMPPGTHYYTFTYDLPHEIPTSFEGSTGYIRYYVIIDLETPLSWNFDQKFKTAFTVLKQFDLNIDANLLSLPSQGTVDQNLSFGPFKNGPVTIIANTAQTGYVPGQTIIVHADIQNASTAKINEIRFSFQQIIRYISIKPKIKTRMKVITVAEARVGYLDQNQQNRTFDQYLQIPSLPPSCTSLCKIITITYEVRVEAKVSGFYRNPEVKIPITLGTIPLTNNVFSTVPNSNLSQSTVNPTGAPRVQGNMPPPSYEECIFGAAQVRDDEDDENTVISCTNCTPRYPVYNCSEWPNGRTENQPSQ